MFVQARQTAQASTIRRSADYASLTDVQIIVACQNHDEKAFDCLRKRYLRLVSSILFRLAPEQRDTDDLVQEVFLRVWRSINALRNPESFSSWLGQIVTNCFYNELRRRPAQACVYIDCPLSMNQENSNSFIQLADLSALPDELAESQELSDGINLGLTQLAADARQVILLRNEGLSYKEIASLTNTELGTVKSRLSRARKSLKTRVLAINSRYFESYASA